MGSVNGRLYLYLWIRITHLYGLMILHVHLDDSDSVWMSLQQLLQLGGPGRLTGSSHDMISSSNELLNKLQAYAP